MGSAQSVPDEIESPDSSNRVHMAAYGNHIEKLKQMKLSKENLFERDEKNRIPLHYASATGATQSVEFLLEQQGQSDYMDMKDLKELTSLDYACIAVSRNSQTKSRAFECVKLLLSAGCDFNSLKFMPLETVATDGRTLIHWAAKCGHTKLLKCLLEKRPEFVTSKDRRGWTPLMCASLCTSDTVGETLNFLLNFSKERSNKVEAMEDVFAALAIGVETWNHAAVDVLLTCLGETASNEGEHEVCRLFNAHAATAASVAAMVSTIAAVVATKVATDAGIAFEKVRRKRWRKIAKLSLNSTSGKTKMVESNITSIKLLDRMHTRRHHDNWLHWIRRVSRDVDEHYEAAMRSNEMYWPEMSPDEEIDESSMKKSSAKFYSHRTVIESIPEKDEEDDDNDEDRENDTAFSGIGIAHGGNTLQTTLTLLGLEDKEDVIRQDVGYDLSFLHWSTKDLQRGERADKTDRKYKALRGILNEDEIDVLRKGLRITQDLRMGTSLELGESNSYVKNAKKEFSIFKESLSMLRENSIDVNTNRIPPAWSRFQSVLEGLAERFDIVGACQNMFLTKNVGIVVPRNSSGAKKITNKTKVRLYKEANLHSDVVALLEAGDQLMLQSRSNGFVLVVEHKSQRRGWILNDNVSPTILPSKLTDLVEEKCNQDKSMNRAELDGLVEGLLEIMTVIQQFRYEVYCQELEENIFALDHPYFPSRGDPIRVSKIRPLRLEDFESYTWYEKTGHGLALRLVENSTRSKSSTSRIKQYHTLDIRHHPIGQAVRFEDKDVIRTAQRYILKPVHRLRLLLSLLGPQWSIHFNVRRKAASLLYMITKLNDQNMSTPIMSVSFNKGDTVMVPEEEREFEDMKGWKIGTVLETKDDDNIVREFAKVRIQTEDNTELVCHTSDIVLLRRNESNQNTTSYKNATRNQNDTSMCVPCCGSSSSPQENQILQSKFMCWRIGRLHGVQILFDLLISSSETTLNEITLKLLVNLLKIPSNSSLLPRTSAGKAAFIPVISRLLDPSATQRASAAEIVKSVLQSDVSHHSQNVVQVAQAGIQPLLMLLLKWIRLMEAENARRRLARDRVKEQRRFEIESETLSSSQGCCAPSPSSSSVSFESQGKSLLNSWHGSEYLRIGEQRDRMRHQAMISNAAANAVSAICGMITLTPVENKMRSDIEHLNRVENELETVVEKNTNIQGGEDVKRRDDDEDVKKMETKEFNFETDVSSALHRAFRRDKVRNLEFVKSEEDLRKRLIQLPSFRVSSVSSDFGGIPLESVPSEKLKSYAEEWAHETDPFRVLQSSILVAWAMEIDMDNLNDILSDASEMINRFTEIALCSTTTKTNSYEDSTYATYSAMQVLMWALWTSCSETDEAEDERQEHENVMKQLHGSVKAEYDKHAETWRRARETIFAQASEALSKICSVKNVGILLKRVVEEARKSVIMLEYTQFLIRSKPNSSTDRKLTSVCRWISSKTDSLRTLVRSTRSCMRKLKMLHNILQTSVRIVGGYVTLPLVLSRAVEHKDNAIGDSHKESCVRCLVQFLLNDSEQQTRLLQQQGVSCLLPLRRYVSTDAKVTKLFEQLSILFGTARTALVSVNLCGNVATKTPHIPTHLTYESIALQLGNSDEKVFSSTEKMERLRHLRPSKTMGSKWILRMESAEQEKDILNLLMPSLVEMISLKKNASSHLSVLQSMGWISLRVDSVGTFLEKRTTVKESAMQLVAKLVKASDDQVACAACVVLANLIVSSSVACGSLRKQFKSACKEIIENNETWREGLGPPTLSSVAQFGHSLQNIVSKRTGWPGAVRHLVELASTLSCVPSRTKIGKSATEHHQGQGKADPAPFDTKRVRFLFGHLAPSLGKIRSDDKDTDILLWTCVRTAVFATAAAVINRSDVFRNEDKFQTMDRFISDDDESLELTWKSLNESWRSSSRERSWFQDASSSSPRPSSTEDHQADEDFVTVRILGNGKKDSYVNKIQASKTTVHDLRVKIARQEGVPASSVRLYCEGIQLAELGLDILERAVDTMKSLNSDENVDLCDSIPISIVRESVWLVAASKSYSMLSVNESEVLQIVLQQPPEVGLPTTSLLYQIACQKKHRKSLEIEGASEIIMEATKMCMDERMRRLLLKTVGRLRET